MLCALQVRRVLGLIRGETYEKAIMVLTYTPYRSCEPILKCLLSVSRALQATSMLGSSSSSDELALHRGCGPSMVCCGMLASVCMRFDLRQAPLNCRRPHLAWRLSPADFSCGLLALE